MARIVGLLLKKRSILRLPGGSMKTGRTDAYPKRGFSRCTGPLAIRRGSSLDIYTDMPVGKITVENISPDRSVIDQIYESIECPGNRCAIYGDSCFECKLRWWGEQELMRSRKRDQEKYV